MVRCSPPTRTALGARRRIATRARTAPTPVPQCHVPTADPTDPLRTTADSRALGLIVCRGPQVTVVVPEDGMTEIPNPFTGGGEEEAPTGAEGDAAMGGT